MRCLQDAGSTSCQQLEQASAFSICHAPGRRAPSAPSMAHRACSSSSSKYLSNLPCRMAHATSISISRCKLSHLHVRQPLVVSHWHRRMQLVPAAQVTPQEVRALQGRSGSWQEPPPAASLGTRKAAGPATWAPQAHTSGCVHPHKAVCMMRCTSCSSDWRHQQ